MHLSEAEAERLGIDIDAGLMRRRGRPKKPPVVDQKRRLFYALCEAHGLPTPAPEYPFAEELDRKWRFDWLFDGWLALEVQGGLFLAGRHTQGAALLKEHEKLNAAVIMGYAILFCVPKDIDSGAIFPVIKAALKGREEHS